MRPVRKHLAFAFLGILGACDMFGGSSDQNNAVSGGSSEQGNAVSVVVLDSAGLPYAGARVLVRPSGWTSDSTRACESLCGFAGLADSSGAVGGVLAPGRYVVTSEVDWFGSYGELVVDSSGQSRFVARPEAQLRMEGVAPAQASSTLFVPGTGRTIRFDAQGRFQADSLPPGMRRLLTRDGRSVAVDSLVPGTVSFFSSLPMPGAAAARPDSTLFLPPVLQHVDGDGATSPWHVRIRPRVPGTPVEWSRDSGDSWSGWSESRSDFYVDTARAFWFRARRPGVREGVHHRERYQVRVAPSAARLQLEDSLPGYRLQAWRPDSVWVARDTLWILSIANSCYSLPWHGVAARHFEDTLHVWRRECPDGLGGYVRILLNLPAPRGIWTVSTRQPLGHTWEIP